MKLEKMIVSGFRCFSSEPTTIDFGDLTALIGKNGTGKTAALMALARIFGISSYDRVVTKDDFYVENGKTIDDYLNREFTVDLYFRFPEIEESAHEEKVKQGTAIPDVFSHMSISQKEGPLLCRILMEAKWAKSSLPGGEIDMDIFWIKNLDARPDLKKAKKFKQHDRSKIHVVYVPAHREPDQQLRDLSSSYMGQFMRAMKWSDAPKKILKESIDMARASIDKERGVSVINEVIDSQWKSVNDTHFLSNPKLNFIDGNIDNLISKAQIIFDPSSSGETKSTDFLSDGQKSLFYFSLLKTFLTIHSAINRSSKVGGQDPDEAFDTSLINFPILTIFAIEEPENHLSPHYVGKLLKSFTEISELADAQVLYSTHSPSALSRVDPGNIRHFSLDKGCGRIRRIVLPDESLEMYKYIKLAVQAYPELYFSKLVLLCEGPSEEIIFKRLFSFSETPLDESYISVVPLGGRGVHHFWRLLRDLDIPFITLLDLDAGREGGGWERIKYLVIELLEIKYKLEKISADAEEPAIDKKALSEMHKWPLKSIDDRKRLRRWVEAVRARNVFLSYPIDIDWSMLNSFKDKYQAVVQQLGIGPRIPSDSKDKDEYFASAKAAVLGAKNVNFDIFYDDDNALFATYRYLFHQHSKPAVHQSVVSDLERDELMDALPPEIQLILDRAKSKIGNNEGE